MLQDAQRTLAPSSFNVSIRTAYYRQAAFRRLFGEWHSDPTPLARYVNQWAAKALPTVEQHLKRAKELNERVAN